MGGGIGLGIPFAPGDPMAVRASGGQADLALVRGGLNREGGVQRGMIRDGKRQGLVWCRAPVALDKAGRTVVTALNSGTRIELGHPWISLTSSGTLDLNCGGKVRFRGGRIDLEEAGGRWSGLPLKGPKPTVRMPGAPHRAGSLRSRGRACGSTGRCRATPSRCARTTARQPSLAPLRWIWLVACRGSNLPMARPLCCTALWVRPMAYRRASVPIWWATWPPPLPALRPPPRARHGVRDRSGRAGPPFGRSPRGRCG